MGQLRQAEDGGSENRISRTAEKRRKHCLFPTITHTCTHTHARTRMYARTHARAHTCTHSHTQALYSPGLSLGIQAVNSPRHTTESTRSLVEWKMGWRYKAHYRMPTGVHEDRDSPCPQPLQRFCTSLPQLRPRQQAQSLAGPSPWLPPSPPSTLYQVPGHAHPLWAPLQLPDLRQALCHVLFGEEEGRRAR